MVLVTINKPKQILLLSFVGHVRAKELTEGREDLATLAGELSPGFNLITDLGALELLDKDSVSELSRSMELCDQKGVGLIVRVIPDQSKDIGLNILSAFHYPHRPRIVTCKTMSEAAKALGL